MLEPCESESAPLHRGTREPEVASETEAVVAAEPGSEANGELTRIYPGPAGTLCRLRHRLLKISEKETSFDVRGFHERRPETRHELETHGGSFVHGFNLALLVGDADEFAGQALAVPNEERGFAYEGAAMALGILDLLTPGGGGRIEALLQGAGSSHVYMIHVGAGWAFARLHRRPWGRLGGLDPLLRWLAVDGYGFHEGFFKQEPSVRGQRRPRRIAGYATRVFDQGLGRSLWFVEGGDCERIAATVSGFAASRQGDLWSGVGLAATYAGGVRNSDLHQLAEVCGAFLPALAQGAGDAIYVLGWRFESTFRFSADPNDVSELGTVLAIKAAAGIDVRIIMPEVCFSERNRN